MLAFREWCVQCKLTGTQVLNSLGTNEANSFCLVLCYFVLYGQYRFSVALEVVDGQIFLCNTCACDIGSVCVYVCVCVCVCVCVPTFVSLLFSSKLFPLGKVSHLSWKLVIFE